MENLLQIIKPYYKNLVTEFLPPPSNSTTKNIMIVDGGNTSMKFLDARGNLGNIKTARVKIDKKNEPEPTHTTRDYYVKIEKYVNSKYKDCGEYLFGLAAISDYRNKPIDLGNEKYKDIQLIYQIITIVADKSRKNEPVELRTMLPYTQIGYKSSYIKELIGKWRVTFYNKNDLVVNLNIETVGVTIEGSQSLKQEIKKITDSREVKNGYAEEYVRKIICMFDIGGGQVDIPAFLIEKEALSNEIVMEKLTSYSTNFGMNYIATLLLQVLETKNIRTTAEKVNSAIISYNNKLLTVDGKEYDFTKELYEEAIIALEVILKQYIDNLKAQGINNQVGLVYLSGGGSLVIIKALTEKIFKKNAEKNLFKFEGQNIEIKISGEPIYHNVLSMRGEKVDKTSEAR